MSCLIDCLQRNLLAAAVAGVILATLAAIFAATGGLVIVLTGGLALPAIYSAAVAGLVVFGIVIAIYVATCLIGCARPTQPESGWPPPSDDREPVVPSDSGSKDEPSLWDRIVRIFSR